MSVEEQVYEIRNSFRLAMNGVATGQMKKAGYGYRLNYGVGLPQLKEMQTRYRKSSELAALLWKQDVRECKILAVLLYPPEEFSPDLADLWLEQAPYPDLVEICAMYLFSKMKGASVQAFKWMAGSNDMVRYAGFLTLAHLLKRGEQMNGRYLQEFKDQAATAVAEGLYFPSKGAGTALECFRNHYGEK